MVRLANAGGCGTQLAADTWALVCVHAEAVDVLVATDLASRGIDVAKVQHVVLYDMPGAIEDYVHRIGELVDV